MYGRRRYLGEDGKVYTATAEPAPKDGLVTHPIATTVQGQPALVAEKGPEIVIGRETTKAIMMNEPELIRYLANYQQHGGRRLLDSGNGEYVAICSKPELSKATRKRKAKTSNALAFKHLMEVSQAILRNPERRAAWEAQYEEAKRKAYKYGKPIQGRLCDYVRHHVSEALKSGEEIIP